MHCLYILLKLRQGQGPGTPLRSLDNRPRSPFHQTLGVKHPITTYSTLSNLVNLARSRPAECPLPRERPFPDSPVISDRGVSQPHPGHPFLVLPPTSVTEKVRAVVAQGVSFRKLNRATSNQETLSQVTQHIHTSLTTVRMTHTH